MIQRSDTSRAPMRCPRDTMTPRNTFRLFVTLLIIVATIIESPVSAFSHSRRPDTARLNDDIDLYTKESAVDEVRYNSTPASTVEVVDTPNITKEIAARTSAKVYEIKGEPNVEDKVELTTAFILLKTDDGYLKITGLPIYTSSVKETEPLSSLETTGLPDSTYSLTQIRRQDDNKTDSIEELTTTNDLTSNVSQNTETGSSDIATHETPEELTLDTTYFDKNIKLVDNTFSETLSTEPIRLTTVESVDTTSQIVITTNDKIEETSNARTTSSKVSEIERTEQNTSTLTPPRKKYTTIDRKRSGALKGSLSTERDVESSPTRVSLEKLLTDTSISSLGELGEALNSKSTFAFDVSSTSPFGQETISFAPDISTTGPTSTVKQTSPRTLQITSKRAGFLDYSSKPIAEEATTIIENYDIPDKINESRGFSSMFEFEPETETVSTTKNNSGRASQSRLAEDVMIEEMMKEEVMNNQAENANRYKEADHLSVKPIDKTTLYSVGPNYKPMKKLEVQPAKPFIRDPDDLSWRNESISSLGIVFKAKPAAKNFTQVLKNKTGETLLSNGTDKDSKNDIPDLRERLEKIAEVRKSKKKKVIDKFGETIYTDYEENLNSAETTAASTPAPSLATLPTRKETKYTEHTQSLTNDPDDLTTHVSVQQVYQNSNSPEPDTTPTPQPKKYNGVLDYYEVTDEYDDYINFPKIDLKKFTTRLHTKDTPSTTTSVATSPFQKPSTLYWPDRKPTIQYFPPRPSTSQKVNIQGYDEDPIRKLNYFSLRETTKNLIPVPVTFTTVPVPPERRPSEQQKNKHNIYTNSKNNDLEKTVYYTQPRIAAVAGPVNGYDEDGHYNRPTYVIKHYKDLIEKAAKDTDYDKDSDYDTGFTQSPLRGVTVNDLSKNTPNLKVEDYDYDSSFRKDVINRFVDNFNQNSERFKVDFPILYNNSVVHRNAEDSGPLATSSAFMKRLYENMRVASKVNPARDCEGCERNVDLPPSYELHYYVPEQEEKEEAESHSPVAYRYAL